MTTWTKPSAAPPLAPEEVHLWRVELSAGDGDLARHQASLSSEERARAERFASPHDGRRYIQVRGMVRAFLAGYLGKTPASLVFGYGLHGKPELQGEDSLRFNLSHSGELAVLAFARVEVGVDIERVRPEVDVNRLAARALPRQENAWLQAMPGDQKLHAFFACWTRQEARLKAVGSGWSENRGSLEERLAVYPFDCAGGFLGALAVAGPPRRLRFFDA